MSRRAITTTDDRASPLWRGAKRDILTDISTGGFKMASHMLGMRSSGSSILAVTVLASLLPFGGPATAQTPSALAGQETSQPERAIEVVLVIVTRLGTSMIISAVPHSSC